MTAFRAFGDAATDRGLHLGDGLEQLHADRCRPQAKELLKAPEYVVPVEGGVAHVH